MFGCCKLARMPESLNDKTSEELEEMGISVRDLTEMNACTCGCHKGKCVMC